MKKSIFASILVAIAMSVSSMAIADSYTVEAGHADNGTNSVGIYLAKDFAGFTFDARLGGSRTDKAVNGSSIDIRVKKSYDIYGNIFGWTRVGVGEAFSTGTRNSQYQVEQAVGFKVSDDLSVWGSLKRQDAFNVDNKMNNVQSLGMSYNVTKVDVIGTTWEKYTGDSQRNNYKVAYTRKF